MLYHFSQNRVRGQIQKSAADVRHDQPKPKERSVGEEEKSDRAAEESGRFHSRYPGKRGRASKPSANQETAQGETFRNLVNAQSQK